MQRSSCLGCAETALAPAWLYSSTPLQAGVYPWLMKEPASTVKVLTSGRSGRPYGTIAICVRDHINTATFMSALHNDWKWLRNRGTNEQAITWLVVQGSMLPLQRNECLKQMDGDWLLFIDDDMTWEPEAIGQLVASWEELRNEFDEPVIVGGLCHRREPPHDPTMYARDGRYEGKYRFMETWDGDVVEVDATGLAFALIPVTAIEAIMGTEFPNKETRMLYQSPPIFEWTAHMGEDLRFMQQAKAAGCRVFVDTRIKIGHVAEIQVDHRSFLEHLALRSREDEDMVRAINDKHGLPTMTAEEAKEQLGWTTRPEPSDEMSET